MVTRDTSFITVIYGEDVTEEQAEKLQSDLLAKFGSNLEITLVNGGQPVYYFMIGVE